MNRLLIIICVLFSSGAMAQAKYSSTEIMQKNEDVRRLKDINSQATLSTGVPGAEKLKKFTWWRKLTSNNVHFNTLTRFHLPAEIKGEGILFLEHENDNADVLLYLPAYKKTRRVERSAQSTSFMGSEFSYSDIATPHVDDYHYKTIREERCEVNRVACWVIEAKPVRPETLERTGYSKMLQWIRQDNFMMEKTENYDRDGTLWKKISFSETKEVDVQEHKWMSLRVEVRNLKNGKHTVLQFESPKVNKGISDVLFTQQNLSKI